MSNQPELPSGVEKRIAAATVALCERFRVSSTGIHSLAIAGALWDAYRLGRLMGEVAAITPEMQSAGFGEDA